ncbi:LOW QUALITY PROTEIN: ras association domain-containing protein 10-like [Synchiropus picturatus]
MEAEDGQISVWVCREEKLVSGLTRRTTCADVLRVLLEDQKQGASAARLSGSPQSYCVVEKWRGFERILPNKTKVLRLWSAWGAEQENVRFVLLKNDASLPNSGPRSAEAKVVQSREGLGPARGPPGPATAAPSLSQDRQRRIVRKAFRKLDKMQKKKKKEKEEEEEEEEERSRDQAAVERMETMVHLVLSQDHTIRQQVQRLQDLHLEIERYEARVHMERIQRHGANYVQDTYLLGPEEARAQLEEYAQRCEDLAGLQEQLTERELLLEKISGQIQEELNCRWMRRRRRHREETAARDLSQDRPALEEEQRIRTQLDTSLYVGLRLKTDLDSVRGDLDLSRALWETKEGELLDLLAQVESLDLELQQGGQWAEQPRGPARADANDEDSDTGLSSMHSQDSDNPPACESLV